MGYRNNIFYGDNIYSSHRGDVYVYDLNGKKNTGDGT